jgi:hypothetical protein
VAGASAGGVGGLGGRGRRRVVCGPMAVEVEGRMGELDEPRLCECGVGGPSKPRLLECQACEDGRHN